MDIERIKKINVVMVDIDSVLTDGRMIYADSGDELKNFHVHDGFGMVLLRRAGIKTIILTANKSRMVARRGKILKVFKTFQGCFIKLDTYEKILKKYKFNPDEICFIGDDIIDIPVLKRVGFAVTVPNAMEDVKEYCHYITKKPGGHGAVRELSDLILKTQGKWASVTSNYFK